MNKAAPQPQPPPTETEAKTAKRCIFAAVGDVHGQFSKMVDGITAWERLHDATVDFILQVGDLEPHRHEDDLASMAMPSKHRTLGDFHKVVAGKLPLPWPTYFIGGNHEPWQFLEGQEGDGFMLVPNLFFLGRSSITAIGPLQLRVAALSGIHSANEFSYHEKRPHVSEFPNKSNKAYIHFNHSEVTALMNDEQNQQEMDLQINLVRTLLAEELGLKPLAIEKILSMSGGARVRCISDLLSLSDQVLEEAGIMEGPREKIKAYRERGQARTLLAPTAESNQSHSMCSQDGLVDVLMTHDWPSGIADATTEDPRCRAFGNDPCRMLLEELHPTLMLCGHMHQAHTALVGLSTVRCLGKVPAAGSMAFFEVLAIESDDDTPNTKPTGRRLVILELV